MTPPEPTICHICDKEIEDNGYLRPAICPTHGLVPICLCCADLMLTAGLATDLVARIQAMRN